MNTLKDHTDLTIRINDLNAQPNIFENIQDDFNREQISIQQDPDIPELFHIPAEKKFEILQNKWYKTGRIIIQDKASAAIVQILDPRPNDLICDICAAPGIKTSQISQKLGNSGELFASDVHTSRMLQMKRLIKRFHVQNTNLINADGIALPVRPNHLFDRVLLDAPCTGSGTFFTNPELKWRQNEYFLRQNTLLQEKLLKKALKILKPGGILVYSTCSLYLEEGETQILQIKDAIKPAQMPKWIHPSYKPLVGTGRLFPSIHKAQGFFVAKLIKK